MPSLIIPPGYAMVVFRFRLALDPEEIVCTLGVDASAAGGDAQLIADRSVGAFGDAFPAAAMGTAWTFVGTSVTLGTDGGDPVLAERIVNTAGTTSSVASPPSNCAILVRKLSSFGGRRNKGRFYWPCFGLNETNVNPNGVLDTTQLNQQQANFDNFYDSLIEDDVLALPPVIFHSAEPVLPTPVTQFSVQPLLATQRERMRH